MLSGLSDPGLVPDDLLPDVHYIRQVMLHVRLSC
jgi:hypothetical protein